MEVLVAIEKAETGFGAHVPDLPGCIAVAETEEKVAGLIREAVEFHIDTVLEPLGEIDGGRGGTCCLLGAHALLDGAPARATSRIHGRHRKSL